jgi:hypothetical protein
MPVPAPIVSLPSYTQPPPQAGQPRDAFNKNMQFAFGYFAIIPSAINETVDGINAIVTFVNQRADDADNSAASALDSAGIAQVQANNASNSATSASNSAAAAQSFRDGAEAAAAIAVSAIGASVSRIISIRNSPPGSPSEGDAYIIGDSPTGDWSGNAGSVAVWADDDWQIFSALEGQRVYNVDTSTELERRSGVWVTLAPRRTAQSKAKPTLDLNFADNSYTVYEGLADGFTQKPVAEILDIVRAGPESGMTAIGTIGEVGANDLPLVFDPETGKPLGAQIFGEVTNLLLWSEDFTQSAWAKGNLTVTANDTAAPDGSMTADRLTDAETSASSLITQNVSSIGVIGDVYVATAYLKHASGNTTCTFNCYETGHENNLTFDLITGEILANTGTNLITAGVLGVGGGWWLAYQIFTIVANGSSVSHRIWPNNRTSQPLLGSVYAWGAQLVKAARIAPYVKTEASQVTKPATDVTRIFEGEYNPNEWTVIVELGAVPASPQRWLSIGDGTSNNRAVMLAGNLIYNGSSGGTQTASNLLAPAEIGQPSIVAIRYTASQVRVFANGTDRGGITPSGPLVDVDNMRIGRGQSTPGKASTNYSRVQYIPKALSDDECVAITSGVAP